MPARAPKDSGLHAPASRQRSAEDFDMIIGFLGFWTLVVLAITIWLEVTGQPAILWALGLLAMVLGLWGMIRLRRRLPPRVGRRPR
ncbi:hypothetical protein [Specibacter sp. RAF43]|uniref:hypothetical protein n=1 Tax=Specibacter sp. RAF43 TaxID=3233057 RepID=UPI003F9A5711